EDVRSQLTAPWRLLLRRFTPQAPLRDGSAVCGLGRDSAGLITRSASWFPYASQRTRETRAGESAVRPLLRILRIHRHAAVVMHQEHLIRIDPIALLHARRTARHAGHSQPLRIGFFGEQ